MPETISRGPGGYAEVSGTAGSPHGDGGSQAASQPDMPFQPPDISALGYGTSGGGSTGSGGNRGGTLADAISGVGKVASTLIKVLPEAAA